MVQSSTYSTCPQYGCKSFMWCIKPIGPNIVPCGTPALILMKSDFTLPIFTRCLRWHRKDVSHLMMKFGSPSGVHLVSRVWWSTLSKAVLKLTRRIRIMVSGARATVSINNPRIHK